MLFRSVETGVGFEASTPALVVEGAYFETSASIGSRSYDISPDGQRFLMLTEGAPTNPDDTVAGLTQIHVVLNWDQELLERVPVP